MACLLYTSPPLSITLSLLTAFVLVAGAARLQSEKNAVNNDNVIESGGDYVDNTSAVNATPSAVQDETLNVDYANGNVDTTQAPSDDVQEEITSSVEEDTTPAETETETEQVTEPVSEEKMCIRDRLCFRVDLQELMSF